MVLETDSNNHTALNVYGTNLLYREAKALDEAATEGYYYIYNTHGDVTSLIDKEGNIAATYDYDAFGNILSETGTADNPIRYSGYQYDIESGLYYLNARYYDSKIARFITEDTYRGEANDPLSLNLYAYCANNPILYVDPSGHEYITRYNGSMLETVWKDDYYFRYDGSELREYIRTEEYDGPLDAYKAKLENNQTTSLKKKPTNQTKTTNTNNSDGVKGTGKTETSATDKLVAAAKAELGFKENTYINAKGKEVGDNKTPYGEWYGLDQNPWCAMFVSYVANEAGILQTKQSTKDINGNILAPTVPKFAAVSDGVKWYKNNERFESKESGYEPKVGDIIFFTNKGQNHVGIVTAYNSDEKIVYTIEGNTGDSVAERKYDINAPKIVGYGKNGGTSSGIISNNATSGEGYGTR